MQPPHAVVYHLPAIYFRAGQSSLEVLAKVHTHNFRAKYKKPENKYKDAVEQ